VALERNQLDRAEELLANRLDVIEHSAMPDAILQAYRTLSRVAMARGKEHHALAVLKNLRDFASAHSMPRLKSVSLAEEIRIHVFGDRPETACQLLQQLEAMHATFQTTSLAPMRSDFELNVAISRAYCALVSFDPAGARQALEHAEKLATQLQRGRKLIVIKVLRAVAAHALSDEGALSLLREAASLADLNGLGRVIEDSFPRVVEMLEGTRVPPRSIPEPAPATPVSSPRVVAQGGLLTPKEAQILGLLEANLSNKLIARAMDISGDTVKWHLKNLFSKLNAVSRRHVVDRARLLGLLES
jgi:LuxR family maltose regulon positive regulatory protein